MKIVEYFLIFWGKWSELEPEPEVLTSWSRSWTGSATLVSFYTNGTGNIGMQLTGNIVP
jgi:hypothetical protein